MVFYLFNRDQKKKPGKLLSEMTAYEDSEGSEYLPSESELEEFEGLYFMSGHTQTFCSTLLMRKAMCSMFRLTLLYNILIYCLNVLW